MIWAATNAVASERVVVSEWTTSHEDTSVAVVLLVEEAVRPQISQLVLSNRGVPFYHGTSTATLGPFFFLEETMT